MLKLRRRLLPLAVIAFLLFGGGTLGYILIEGWSMVEAFYMTAITLTTVGFGEVRPLSELGRLFTVGLILMGVGSVAYAFSTVGEYLLTAGVADRLRKRQMFREIEKLHDHVIVCGYGRVGRSAIEALGESRRPIVVIEKESDTVQDMIEAGLTVVEGDATRDETLRQAGIERASGLIVCGGDDSVNLFIVLSARALNADLYIVARSVDAENESKMRRAGADRVVSPYQIGGKHMANIIVRPHVTDFFDVVTLNGGIELWVEEFVIESNSELAGQTVGQADIRQRTGVTLVSVTRHDSGAMIMPQADTRLDAGDELIVLGTREQLSALQRLTESELDHRGRKDEGRRDQRT